MFGGAMKHFILLLIIFQLSFFPVGTNSFAGERDRPTSETSQVETDETAILKLNLPVPSQTPDGVTTQVEVYAADIQSPASAHRVSKYFAGIIRKFRRDQPQSLSIATHSQNLAPEYLKTFEPLQNEISVKSHAVDDTLPTVPQSIQNHDSVVSPLGYRMVLALVRGGLNGSGSYIALYASTHNVVLSVIGGALTGMVSAGLSIYNQNFQKLITSAPIIKRMGFKNPESASYLQASNIESQLWWQGLEVLFLGLTVTAKGLTGTMDPITSLIKETFEKALASYYAQGVAEVSVARETQWARKQAATPQEIVAIQKKSDAVVAAISVLSSCAAIFSLAGFEQAQWGLVFVAAGGLANFVRVHFKLRNKDVLDQNHDGKLTIKEKLRELWNFKEKYVTSFAAIAYLINTPFIKNNFLFLYGVDAFLLLKSWVQNRKEVVADPAALSQSASSATGKACSSLLQPKKAS